MYYVLGEYKGPHRWMKSSPYIEDVSFWKGAIITENLPEPLEYTLKPLYPNSEYSPKLPAFYDHEPPLFRDDLVDTLKGLGITNFDTYDAAIFDPDTKQTYFNYKAVNILGLVSAANMAESEATVHDNIPLIDVDFDKLVIDEKRTYGLMMFRLAESASTVLIHEKLKKLLEDKGFGDELQFWNPNEIAI